MNHNPQGTRCMRVRTVRTVIEDHYVLVSQAASDPIATAAAVVAAGGQWATKTVSDAQSAPTEIAEIAPIEFCAAAWGVSDHLSELAAFLPVIEAPATPAQARAARSHVEARAD